MAHGGRCSLRTSVFPSPQPTIYQPTSKAARKRLLWRRERGAHGNKIYLSETVFTVPFSTGEIIWIHPELVIRAFP